MAALQSRESASSKLKAGLKSTSKQPSHNLWYQSDNLVQDYNEENPDDYNGIIMNAETVADVR